jgi:hypothetical protein
MKNAEKKIRADLERIREWACDKIGAGNEPPWAWYQYMKLRESLDAILGGFSMAIPADSLRSGSYRESGLRLVASKYRRDTAPLHQPSDPEESSK